MVDVYIKKEFSMDAVVEMWRLNNCQWNKKAEQLARMEAEGGKAEGRLLLRPKRVLEAHAAALFLKYGFDKDGLMPYEAGRRLYPYTLNPKP